MISQEKLEPVEPFTAPLHLLKHVTPAQRDALLRAVIDMAYDTFAEAEISPYVRGYFEALTGHLDPAAAPTPPGNRFDVKKDDRGWFVTERTMGEVRPLAAICLPFQGENWAAAIAAALNSAKV